MNPRPQSLNDKLDDADKSALFVVIGTYAGVSLFVGQVIGLAIGLVIGLAAG